MSPEPPQTLTREDALASHATLMADVREILDRPAGAPPPRAALDRLADQERVSLVVVAAQERLEQLYGGYRHAVEQHTAVAGVGEEQAAAARASALDTNDRAA